MLIRKAHKVKKCRFHFSIGCTHLLCTAYTENLITVILHCV